MFQKTRVQFLALKLGGLQSTPAPGDQTPFSSLPVICAHVTYMYTERCTHIHINKNKRRANKRKERHRLVGVKDKMEIFVIYKNQTS